MELLLKIYKVISLILLTTNMRMKSKGFTLVETLIYLGLFVMLIIVIIDSISAISTSYKNIKELRAIESSAMASMDRMISEIRNANSVDTADTTFNSNPGQLSLINGTSTRKFYVLNNRLMINEDGSIGPLTGSDIKVTSLIFRSIATTTSSAVKIELSLRNVASSTSLTENFYMTATLRGSY